MHIRPINSADDMQEIIQINTTAKQETHGDILPADTIEKLVGDPSNAEQQWMKYEKVDDLHHRIFIAEDNGTVEGYGYFLWSDNKTSNFVNNNSAELSELYISPDFWQQGIGTKLLERGLEFLPDDIDALELETFPTNEIAKSFYEKHSFERIGSYESEIGDESYLMDIYALRLNQSI